MKSRKHTLVEKLMATNVEDPLHHFAKCILEDRKPIASGELGRYVVEVMDKAYEPSEAGKAINLK